MAQLLIVDDHPLVRQGVRGVLERSGRHRVIGEAAAMEEAQTLIAAHPPDLVTVDLTLAGGHGFDLIRWIALTHPACRTLVVSMHDEALYAERALKLGSQGYLMKDQAVDELLVAVERVMAGHLYLSPPMTERLVGRTCGRPGHRNAMNELTPRELQVLELIGLGHGTGDVARSLSLSVKTIETYRARLKDRLGLPDAPALTRYAVSWVLQRENETHAHEHP